MIPDHSQDEDITAHHKRETVMQIHPRLINPLTTLDFFYLEGRITKVTRQKAQGLIRLDLDWFG